MTLDVWFPLAVYYVDLPDAAANRSALLDRIETLRRLAGGRRTAETTSWTGDVHNVDRIHLDQGFDWLTGEVARHAFEYLGMLGHDLDKTDIHVQRAWPIVAENGQGVSRHAHHTAHLSAVYYVAAPPAGAGGRLCFYDDHRPNELSGAIGSEMTGGYARWNALNFASAAYEAVPGRLLLFPAKQTHSVEAYQGEEPRVSISYDLVLTSRGGAEDGRHEFLMPPPSVWRRLARSAPVAHPEAPAIAATMPLSQLTTRQRPTDEIALCAREGHVLWETIALPHICSPAARRDYAVVLAGLPPEAWRQAGDVARWDGCADWQVWRDAVDGFHDAMQQRGVPLDGARLTAPSVEWRTGTGEAPFGRAATHLDVWVRLDSGAGACAIEMADGGTFPLTSGSMLLSSGSRLRRIVGASQLLHFGVDLPAVARTAILSQPSMQAHDVLDATVFAVLTAQPLARPAPPPDLLFEKLRQLDSRAQRQARHTDCPAVRRYLIDNADPASAAPADIDRVRAHGLARTPADAEAVLIEREAMLDARQCAVLRGHADAHMSAVVPDTVDDLPEYQVNLSLDQLTQLIGAAAVASLLVAPGLVTHDCASSSPGYARIDILLRLFSPETRPYIAFHADICDVTVNVALSDDADTAGGRLVMLAGDSLRAVDRRLGSAVVHAGNLVHGVSRIERGARHSLILFFHREAPADNG